MFLYSTPPPSLFSLSLSSSIFFRFGGNRRPVKPMDIGRVGQKWNPPRLTHGQEIALRERKGEEKKAASHKEE